MVWDREGLDCEGGLGMSPHPGKLPLAGVREIALLAGVSSQAVVNWRARRADFPEPVAELSTGPVYWQPDVEAWLASRG
jgi:hypothetical protein